LESVARAAEQKHCHAPRPFQVPSKSALASKTSQPDHEVAASWVTAPSPDRPAPWRPELSTPLTSGVPPRVPSTRTLPSNWRALRRPLVPSANLPESHQDGISRSLSDVANNLPQKEGNVNADRDDGSKSYTPLCSELCVDEQGSASACCNGARGSGTESGSDSDGDTPVATQEEDGGIPLEAPTHAIEQTPDAETIVALELPDQPAGPPMLDDPFKLLRLLLADAVEIVDWYTSSEDEKLAMAELLPGALPRLLDTLENEVLNVVLEDTVAELTRVGNTRELHGVPSAPAVTGRTGGISGDVDCYDVDCYIALREAELREKYRCHF